MKKFIKKHKKEILLIGGTIALTMFVGKKIGYTRVSNIEKYFTDISSCPDIQGLEEMYIVGFDSSSRPWIFNIGPNGTTDILDFASVRLG